ncbi:hypothetical protein NHX12_023836 [Muraenolepis orangiensis]|uniref:Glutathione S-transferase n=1 Tax=Muraenolepis orangiensis TaxID=630683 RepID=A0A9Q0IT64_9TELE|nr:hypothetical protein NHX12_023836 [Muraenolepis orangiensis]
MAKDMSLLWFSGSPPCLRVMIALEEKNLQGYEQKLLSYEKGEHRTQEVRDVNPRCQLPVLTHGDNIINESYAVCLYLEAQFKSQGTQLIPDGPAQQALMYQRMFEGVTLTEKIADVIYYQLKIPEGERHDSAVKRHREALTTELKLWEGYLEKMGAGSYLAGKNFSLADVVIFPCFACCFRFGLSAKNYPKLADYYGLLKERPSVEASWTTNWQTSPPWGKDKLKDL